MALKLYLRNSVTPHTPAAIQGDWDDTAENAVLAMLDAVGGTKTTHDSLFSGTLTNHDRLSRTFVYQLPQDFYVDPTEDGNLRAVVGLFEKAYPAAHITLYSHWHLYTLRVSGEVETVIETLVDDVVGGTELDDLFCALAVAASAVMLLKDDYLILELGWRGTTADPVYGGTRRALNSYSGASAAQDSWPSSYNACSWIQLPGVLVTAPEAPVSVDVPEGGESWREGSVQTLEWTPDDPEQAEDFNCLYDVEFSAAGDFTDAVTVVEGEADASYAWTLPESLVGAEGSDTCKIRVRSRVEGTLTSSDWVESAAFEVLNSTAPTVTLIDPEDDELFRGGLDLMPTFMFGTADTESDPVHVELVVSYSADYSDPIIDTDSATDYADWEKAAGPGFATWVAMGSGGAAAGYRIRYKPDTQFRYDYCYGKVRLKDAYSTATFTEFEFTIVVDPDLKLSVTIGGTSFNVKDMQITENTGGDVSPISFAVSLPAYRANPFGKGDAVAIASGLGDHNRTWNGTIELRRPSGSLVSVIAYQDDMYLEEKLCTGDQGSADLGANLAAMVTSYGSPLTGTNIDTSTGVTQAIDGGYKSLRDKFDEAKDLLPDFIGPWVDAGADIHFISQDDLPAPLYRLYEGVPVTHAIPKTIVRYSTGGEADEVVCANLPTGYYLQVTDSEAATANAAETAGTATVDTSALAASPYVKVGVYDGDPDVDGELVEELTATDFDDMADADLYAYVTLIKLIPPVSPELSTIGVKNRVYVSVKDSSPLTVAYATNDATDPKYSESPREWWMPIESGDSTLCGNVADAQLAFRKLEREKLTGLSVNLTYGLGVLRGTAVWVTIPTMDIDGMYPVRLLQHNFATGAHSTTVDVGDYEYVRDLNGAVLKLGKSLVRLEKEAAI